MDLKVSKNGARLITEGTASDKIEVDRKFAKKLMKYSKEYGDVFQRVADDIDDGIAVEKSDFRELVYSLRQIQDDKGATGLANKLYKMKPEPVISTPDNNFASTPDNNFASTTDNGFASTTDAVNVSSTPMPDMSGSVAALEESAIFNIWKSVLDENFFPGMDTDQNRAEVKSKMDRDDAARTRAAKNAKRRSKKKEKKDDWGPGKELPARGILSKHDIDWNGFQESLRIIREFEKKYNRSLNEAEVKSVFSKMVEKLVKEGKVRACGRRDSEEDETKKKSKLRESGNTSETYRKLEVDIKKIFSFLKRVDTGVRLERRDAAPREGQYVSFAIETDLYSDTTNIYNLLDGLQSLLVGQGFDIRRKRDYTGEHSESEFDFTKDLRDGYVIEGIVWGGNEEDPLQVGIGLWSKKK